MLYCTWLLDGLMEVESPPGLTRIVTVTVKKIPLVSPYRDIQAIVGVGESPVLQIYNLPELVLR